MAALKETFARIAFTLTGARWASEWTSEVRVARRWAAMERAHLAAGGTVVIRKGRGFFSASLEA